VINLDFSASALSLGERNALMNGQTISSHTHKPSPVSPGEERQASGGFSTLRADAVPALRAFAGLEPALDRRRAAGDRARGHSSRWGRRGSGRQLGSTVQRAPDFLVGAAGRKFDLIVLDPPTWATSSSGMTVDLVSRFLFQDE
jgi:hypothetical protein